MADLTLTHTPADGTRLTGTAKNDGTATVLQRHGFTWSRGRQDWVMPHTRDARADERRIRQAADDLRNNGHRVTVTIDNYARRSYADAEAARDNAAARRAERYTRYADRAATERDTHYAQGQRMLDSIPMGQPILADHYSATREIRFRERMNRHFQKGYDASQRTQRWDRLAEAAGHYTAFRNAPRATLARIERLIADLLRIERQQKDTVHQAVSGHRTPEDLVEDLAASDWHHAEITEQLGYWQFVVTRAEAEGAKVYGPQDFRPGQFAKVAGRWAEVLKVNKKSLSVASCAARREVVTRDEPHMRPGRVPFHTVTGQATAAEVLAPDTEPAPEQAQESGGAPRDTADSDPGLPPEIAELHGRFADGYTDDAIRSVFGLLKEAGGPYLVCVWEYADAYGFGGNSQFYAEGGDGVLHTLSPDVYRWLDGQQTSPGPMTGWVGAPVGTADFPVSDDFHNYALLDGQ
ncbi:DUF3560 domain-containing protein (plasmid) [Streptomyces sp. SDT5-1]|uniref:DUF3560 domain-containing protein n=1 Tax=Streptomyces sp. SDT5-1 TaxID=3406418 RepID=UPI003FD0B8CD